MEYLDYIIANWEQITVITMTVIGAASTIAALTPTPKDDGVLAFVRKIIDLVGQNYGNAKNDPRIK